MIQALTTREQDSLVDSVNLIDRMLEEQKRLTTAVQRFSSWHSNHTEQTAISSNYRDLIPLTRPEPGEQYAFEVDLDVCSGCKACVAACHSLNGLDDFETWRDVGQLHHTGKGPALQQTVTTACHHCADPACSNGCPVLAYDKDEATGIVQHLDDQCIGCQYCILKCPYDVPKYSDKLGIVRKCDMCHSRLSAGEAPACVQSCPNQAIRIIKVSRQEITEASSSNLVPGAFDSSYTQPSTRYLSRKNTSDQLQPADATSLRVEHTHAPLVAMLVLTQAAAGSLLAALGQVMITHSAAPALSFLAAILATAGLASSVLHLGRPLQAWRAFLGWRKSWLSREIIAFGTWFPLVLLSALVNGFPEWDIFHTHITLHSLKLPVMTAAAGLGILSVFTSVMVYVDTKRPFWKPSLTSTKFLGTMLVAGSSFAATVTQHPMWLSAAVLTVLAKLIFEGAFLLNHINQEASAPQTRSARVLWLRLRPLTLARFITPFLGLGLISLAPPIALILILAGEFIERVLFFRAVTAPRMPGTLS